MLPKDWLDMLQDKVSQTKNFKATEDGWEMPDTLTEKEIDKYLNQEAKHAK